MLALAFKTAFDQPVPNVSKEQPISVAKSINAEREVFDRAAKKFRLAKEESLHQQGQILAISSDDSVRQEDDILFDVPGVFKSAFIQGKSVNTLQEWQGYVVSVDERDFSAVLADLTNPTRRQEHATIPIMTIDNEDINKLRPGAYFHLVIGFSRGLGGRHEKKTIIYFRKHIPKKVRAGAKAASILSRMCDTKQHTAGSRRD